ncbi:MAG TPA: hypothetical protein ENK45_00445 [Aliiroseovarius sp.]|nr:hypothetical protein [Aliiroseovarius sp.]
MNLLLPRLNARLAAPLLAALAAIFALATPARALELVMVEQEGCVYCEQWNEEIGPIYPKTAEGRFAPLRRIDIYEMDASGITFARDVNFTPTFVLVEDGRELIRLEGYPGDDFFWPMLDRMLTATTTFSAGES